METSSVNNEEERGRDVENGTVEEPLRGNGCKTPAEVRSNNRAHRTPKWLLVTLDVVCLLVGKTLLFPYF